MLAIVMLARIADAAHKAEIHPKHRLSVGHLRCATRRSRALAIGCTCNLLASGAKSLGVPPEETVVRRYNLPFRGALS